MRDVTRRLAAPCLAAVSCLAAAGCGPNTKGAAGDVTPPAASAVPMPTARAGPAESAEPTGSAGLGEQAETAPLGRAGGWRITTYYTALQSLYDGAPKAVRGCERFHCSRGKAPLGSYPEDFLEVVRMEGGGRITEGPHRGRYLNWSHSVGFWLDDTTRDSRGRPLKAWESAAADRSVLARGQRFAITGCGTDGGGRPIGTQVCEVFRKARWTVTDLFRPGYGGRNHADVYIGEEKDSRLADSPFYTTLNGATLTAP